MKTIITVFYLLLLLYLSSSAQDQSKKQINIDTNSRETVNRLIESKKTENETARIKLDNLNTSWDKLNDLVKRDANQEQLNSQLHDIEKTAMEIRQTLNKNIEAINQVKADLSVNPHHIEKKSVSPDKSDRTDMRSWSQIIQDQNKRSTTPKVSEILTESRNTNVQLQQKATQLMQSFIEMDDDIKKIEAALAEIEEKGLIEKISDVTQLTQYMHSQTKSIAEMITEMKKVIKEQQERQEHAIEQMTKS